MLFLPFVEVVPEFQRVAVFRLGRMVGYRGPGVVYRVPFIERFVWVDRRVIVVDVPPQECISRDNVPLKVNAVVYYKVEHPDKAIIEVRDYHKATVEIAQTTLRSVIGESSLDQVLSDRTEISYKLREIIDLATDAWGVKVDRTEIKDLEIPGGLKTAMAKEAAAERERRAMVIRAQGEFEAAKQLSAAAAQLDKSPAGLQMRYLQTILQVSESGNTVVFAPTPELAHAALTASEVQSRVEQRVIRPGEIDSEDPELA
jgi:regulator of protease activity HflC (stomatin/prohibitin superfamily)